MEKGGPMISFSFDFGLMVGQTMLPREILFIQQDRTGITVVSQSSVGGGRLNQELFSPERPFPSSFLIVLSLSLSLPSSSSPYRQVLSSYLLPSASILIRICVHLYSVSGLFYFSC